MCSVMEWQLTTGGLPGVELCGAWREIVERRTDHGHGETVCGAVFRIRSRIIKKRLPVQNTRAQHTNHTPPLRHYLAQEATHLEAHHSPVSPLTRHCLITHAHPTRCYKTHHTPHATHHRQKFIQAAKPTASFRTFSHPSSVNFLNATAKSRAINSSSSAYSSRTARKLSSQTRTMSERSII